jgi:outer membrane protein assembly factor BamC
MSIKSYNNKYWLVIQGDVEKLWEKIKKFWEKQGFDIAKEESAIGLIETNWLENKHQKEDDFIRNTLRKTLRFLDSSNIKDKYRSRLEVIKRDDQSNVTAIYITHRSTQERGQQSAVFGVENTSWIETTSDPELEIEMLYRLMVFIGGDAQDIKKKFSDKYYSTEKNDKNNELIEEGNELYLNVKESFYRSWRFTGIALDRIGVKIDDRDRKLGVYYINYKPEKPKKEKTLSGLFSFGDDDKKFEEASYLINIKRDDDKTRISVLDKSGKLLNNEVAKLLLKDIQKEL